MIVVREKTGTSGFPAHGPAFPVYRWTELCARFPRGKRNTGVGRSAFRCRPGTYFSVLSKPSLFGRSPFRSSERNHTPSLRERQSIDEPSITKKWAPQKLRACIESV